MEACKVQRKAANVTMASSFVSTRQAHVRARRAFARCGMRTSARVTAASQSRSGV
ncbi:Hypothetical predicted protein [Olea europaea subsp. europaea]|uniref:Uncharacterized protein n=1 Tax=Olea europaea subsp. europaea TaxID=158383 RepID=A0A8S0TNN7_OLEEU|nr:Hypothetical predicted protein [Olea europaea subsp. europaea]